VKSLNCVAYGHVLIKRVTEEVERMLTAVNVNRVFTQSLMLVLLHSIEAARTPLLNSYNNIIYIKKQHNSFNAVKKKTEISFALIKI